MANHSDETKAAAMAALLAGQSVSSVAKEYKLPKGTVSDWKRKAAKTVAGVGENPTQKSEIGDLLLTLVKTNVAALISMSEVMGEKEWARAQSGAEM